MGPPIRPAPESVPILLRTWFWRDYGTFLKKKGKSVLSAERSRVEVFKTSLLDGIDVRETLRNWHLGPIVRPGVSAGFG